MPTCKGLIRALTFAAAIVTSAASAHADTILDFDGLSTSSLGGISAGNPLTEDGYTLSTSDGWTLYAMESGAQSGRFGNNGTTTLYTIGAAVNTVSVDLQQTGGGLFDLVSIDLGEIFRPGDASFAGNALEVDITGTKADSSTVTTSFTLDLLADGAGGIDDFETLLLSSSWSGLSSVQFVAQNDNTTYGTFFNFDNIVVRASGSPVPEPTSLGLLALGLFGVALHHRRRSAKAAY